MFFVDDSFIFFPIIWLSIFIYHVYFGSKSAQFVTREHTVPDSLDTHLHCFDEYNQIQKFNAGKNLRVGFGCYVIFVHVFWKSVRTGTYAIVVTVDDDVHSIHKRHFDMTYKNDFQQKQFIMTSVKVGLFSRKNIQMYAIQNSGIVSKIEEMVVDVVRI